MEWFGKVRNCDNNTAAMMSVRKSAKDKQYNIYFRNELMKLLTMSNYIQFAVDNNRLYFRTTDSVHGTKLVKKQSHCFTKLTDNKNRLAKFAGDYFVYGYNKDLETLYVDLIVIDGKERRR